MLTDQPRITEGRDEEISQYRSVCAASVIGLLLSLLSPLAVVSQSLLLVPLLGMVVCLIGLWRISRRPDELIGRKAALVGLAISCLFAAAVASGRYYHERLLVGEAERFASIWMEQLAEGRPYNACQLLLDRDERHVLGDDLDEYYQSHPKLREIIDERYLDNSAVQTLLAAGATAKIESVQTTGVWRKPELAYVHLLYWISYEEDGQQKTMPLKLGLERKPQDDGTASWKIFDATDDPDEVP